MAYSPVDRYVQSAMEERRRREEEERRRQVASLPIADVLRGKSGGEQKVSLELPNTQSGGGDGGGGAPGGRYTGPTQYSDPTRYEQMGLDLLESLLRGGGGAGLPDWWGDLTSNLLGMTSGEISPDWDTQVADYLRGRWQEESLPWLKEQYVGPGTYWGSERAEGVRRGERDLEGGIGALRAQEASDAKARALQAGGLLSSMGQYEAGYPMQLIQTAMGYGGLGRQIADQNFMLAMQSYLSANPEIDMDLMNTLLQWLNIQNYQGIFG